MRFFRAGQSNLARLLARNPWTAPVDATCVSRKNYVVHGDASFCAAHRAVRAVDAAAGVRARERRHAAFDPPCHVLRTRRREAEVPAALGLWILHHPEAPFTVVVAPVELDGLGDTVVTLSGLSSHSSLRYQVSIMTRHRKFVTTSCSHLDCAVRLRLWGSWAIWQ
jgi:hypothetical protein